MARKAPRVSFDTSVAGRAWQEVFDAWADFIDSGGAVGDISVDQDIMISRDQTDIAINLRRPTVKKGNECIPFKPTILPDPNSSENYAVRFAFGTIGEVVPTNISTTLFYNADTDYFVTATAVVSGGSIQTIQLTLETTPEADDGLSEGVASTSFKLIIGTLRDASHCMFYSENIAATLVAAYKKEKAGATQPGELPYDTWYRWTFSPTYQNT